MQQSSTPSGSISAKTWALLLFLSLLWGGSFIFIGVAVKELSSLVIVLVRVGLAAALLLPIHLIAKGPLPKDRKTWIAAAGMSIFNNVIPFTAIIYGQHYLPAGLAAVLNATTPLFGAVVMALAGAEALSGRRVAGLILGVVGVIVLKGVSSLALDAQSLGILAVLLASLSYGVSGLWAKRRLTGIPPVTSATCQLIFSTIIMLALAFLFDDPSSLLAASTRSWIALAGLAFISTSLAYLVFFQIIAAAGPSVVLLVTMIIPISAIVLASLVLGETLHAQELAGAAIIGLALLIIDGRLLSQVYRLVRQ